MCGLGKRYKLDQKHRQKIETKKEDIVVVVIKLLVNKGGKEGNIRIFRVGKIGVVDRVLENGVVIYEA